jgi:hypothetical protein
VRIGKGANVKILPSSKNIQIDHTFEDGRWTSGEMGMSLWRKQTKTREHDAVCAWKHVAEAVFDERLPI